MRITALSFRGLTCFDEKAEINLDELPRGLVAFVGHNGSGKTSALETIAAALYQDLPSRKKTKSLFDYCNGDAFVRLEATDAGPSGSDDVVLELKLNPRARASEGYLWVNGQAVVAGKMTELQAAVPKLFGSKTLFLATAFSSQSRRGSFLEIPRADRKALFVEMLGIEGIREVHARAKDQVSQAESAVEREDRALGAVLEGFQEGESAETIEREALTLEETVGREEKAAELKKKSLAARRESVAKVAGLAERLQGLQRELAGLMSERLRAHSRMTIAEEDLQAIPEKRADELASVGVDPDLSRVRERAEKLRAEALEKIEAEARDAQAVVDEAEAIEGAARDAEIRWGIIAELERSIRDLEDNRDQDAAERAVEAAEKDLADAERDAALLSSVPCGASSRWVDEEDLREPGDPDATEILPVRDLGADCQLLERARKRAKDAAALRETLAEAKESLAKEVGRSKARQVAIGDQRAALADAREKREKALAMAARVGELHRARALLASAEESRDRADQARDEEIRRAEDAIERNARARKNVEERWAGRETELREAIQAEVERIAAIDAELEPKRVEFEETKEKLAGRNVDELNVRIAELEAEVETHDRQASEARVALGRANDRLERRRADEEKAAALELAADRERLELADWTLLEEALGPNGIQALEVDASGPAVAEIANHLLESCYSARFSIGFRTIRPKKTGKGYVEDFEVLVYDGGQERDVEDLSGGERVVIGETIALALSIFNAKRSGIRWTQTFRDETAGALDGENALAYVELLRRAREVGGLDQVVFVAHQPDVFEAADARLVFDHGRVSLDAAS